MKAQVWERRIVQQSRENAYLEYRLLMMNGETPPERSMRKEQMPGRPELQKPLWQGLWSDAEAGGAPIRNDGTESNRDPEMGKVGTGVRVFPHCPGPLHMLYHMGQNLSGFPPPQPPPQWWTWGPQPHLVPPPHGLRCHSEAHGAQGDNSSAVPKKVPEENQVKRHHTEILRYTQSFMQSLQASLFPDHHFQWSLLKPQVLRGEGRRALPSCVCECVCINNLKQVTSPFTVKSASLTDSLKVCFPTGVGALLVLGQETNLGGCLW